MMVAFSLPILVWMSTAIASTAGRAAISASTTCGSAFYVLQRVRMVSLRAMMMAFSLPILVWMSTAIASTAGRAAISASLLSASLR